jgi:hypothetical protein
MKRRLTFTGQHGVLSKRKQNFKFIFSLLSLIWKTKCRHTDDHAVCVFVTLPINFLKPEPVYMKIGMYTIGTEPISKAWFLNPPIGLHVYVFLSYRCKGGSVKRIPPFGARQRLGKRVPVSKSTSNNRWNASFSLESLSNQKRVSGSVCVSPYLC